MLSTMQDVPLSIAQLLRYGGSVHGAATVSTWTGDPDQVRTETYADVATHAAQLAHALVGLGISGDQRVATFMFNNNEHLEAYLAVPAMGAVLHTLNIRLFPEQLVYIANHAEDQVIIVDSALIPVLARVLPQFSTVRHVIVVGDGDRSPLAAATHVQLHGYSDLLAAQPTTFDWPELDERSAAALCYTSGTTGNPKGVVYSHRSIWLHSMQVCMMQGFGINDHDRILTVVPQFHAMAWGLPYAALMSGASLLMPDRFLQAAPLAQFIEQERPTIAGAVPTIWSDLLNHLDANGGDMSSLREVVIGGSACPPTLMSAFLDRHGVRLIHAWGMTETSPLGTVARPPSTTHDEEAAFAYRVTQGRLPASVQARLIGPDGEPVPWDGDSVGELEVRGPWITGSYHLDPDVEKFAGGWLRTGDVGTLTADGFLTLTDRAKDVIKSGGEWISSVDLENHLMAHPAIAEASVIGVADEKWGERPLATVVFREGASVPFVELRDFLGGRIARWQLPERWVAIDAVPKTSVGKFDKKVLRQQYADGTLTIEVLG